MALYALVGIAALVAVAGLAVGPPSIAGPMRERIDMAWERISAVLDVLARWFLEPQCYAVDTGGACQLELVGEPLAPALQNDMRHEAGHRRRSAARNI